MSSIIKTRFFYRSGPFVLFHFEDSTKEMQKLMKHGSIRSKRQPGGCFKAISPKNHHQHGFKGAPITFS